MVLKRTKIQLSVLISVFLMIYVSADTLLFGTNSNEGMKLIGYAGILPLSLYWMIKGSISKKHLSLAIVLVGLGTLTMLTTGINIKYFYVFVLIVFAAFFCTSVKFEDFAAAYQKIMLFLAIYSVAAFVLYELAYSVISNFPIIENESGLKFINLIFDFSLTQMKYVPHRSFGIFREPGVYMFFLILALIFELFFVQVKSEKSKIIHVGIYVVALVLTFSTAGYIVLALVLLLYLLFGINTSSTHKQHLKLIIFLAGLGAVLWLMLDDSLMIKVFGKLVNENYSKSSRLESINTNIRIIASNIHCFFTGVGFSFVEENFQNYSVDASIGDNTNTIFRIFSTYGFFYVSVLLALWAKFFARVKNIFLAIALLGVFCLCLFNESLIINIILYVIAFYSLNSKVAVEKMQE